MEQGAVIVGAGIGGLVCACLLAAAGIPVTVVEAAKDAGGKMRQVRVGRKSIDAGPTVFTMRWVFDEIFEALGSAVDRHLSLRPLRVLARHAWSPSDRLDLYADLRESADAIGVFAGAGEARRFLDFAARARRIYRALDEPFLRADGGGLSTLIGRAGIAGLPALASISPFTTLWSALGEHFHDARLRQLFGRYATYCGSSPFAAPATLMLVAHVEQDGVWSVDGGMQRLADALAAIATSKGAHLRFGARVAEVTRRDDRADGVLLASGERIAARAVVVNADPAALSAGLLGSRVATAVPVPSSTQRSLSAVTWAMTARAGGFPLSRHNVFFSHAYESEFDDVFARHRLPGSPTVYVCAQDRLDDADAPHGAERLLCLVNAPATGDREAWPADEMDRYGRGVVASLAGRGLALRIEDCVTTTPADFERLFPGTGGALYGRATHGWRSSFERPRARTRVARLYLAGGGTHPGPGVPMAALSGRLAARCVIADLASTSR